MQGNQAHEIVIDHGLIAAHVAGNSQVVERHEDAVRTYKCEPEVYLAQSLVHHPSRHLGEPEVGSGKDSEDGGYRHYQVEVSNHKVGGVQHDVDGGLSEKETADAAADKHGNESQGKQRSAVNA